MMIKVGNEYLDFNDLVETEKQVKLLEDLSTSYGAFSYSFDLCTRINNTRILNNPLPDNISKEVYQKIPASLLTDSGEETFKGYLRVEKINVNYECSFFAGNNNWFGLLSGKLRDIDWSDYDIDQTEITLSNALFNTSGVVFPLIDNGLLAYRGNALLKVEDFVGALYTKDIVNRVFALQGIKVQGELLNDADYLASVVVNNPKSQENIDAASSYVEQSTLIARPGENVEYPVVFQNDSTFPFFDGSLNPFSLVTNSWTAPFKTMIHIELSFVPSIVDASYSQRIYIYINGVFTFVDIGLSVGGLYNSATAGDQENFVLDRTFLVDQGDVLTWTTEWQQSVGSTQNDVVSGWVKITPVFIYKAFGAAMVPDWTQGEFISEIIKQFNAIPTYDAANKTLTLNLFEKIQSHDPVDLSEYISAVEVDYAEFVSDYGKKSFLSHIETEEEEEFRRMPLDKRLYDKGQIDIDNDFLGDEVDIIESEFSSPITYINPVFQMSIEKTNLVEFDQQFNMEFTAVTDSAGRARFAIADDRFQLSDMVRVTDSTNISYNGDYMVITFGAGYIELEGLAFDTNATGSLAKMNFVYGDSDQVYLLHHVPLYTVSKFSGLTQIQVENTDYSTLAPAFYNLIPTNRQIDRDFPFSMAFAEGDQLSVTERYFRLVSMVLNDPVKLLSVAHLPYAIYQSLDFLRPITIKTQETQNQYYLNKISGYKESYLPCEIQLIKL